MQQNIGSGIQEQRKVPLFRLQNSPLANVGSTEDLGVMMDKKLDLNSHHKTVAILERINRAIVNRSRGAYI